MKKSRFKKLLQEARKKGRHGDTVLAHINPDEANLLTMLGGSNTINPETGLPEYFFSGWKRFFRNPAKTIRKSLSNPKRLLGEIAAVGGAIFGGPLGGALGGAIRAATRKQNPLTGALSGAAYGTVAPMAANLAGKGLAGLGLKTAGSTLRNYAGNNMGSWAGNIAKVGSGVRGLGLPFTDAPKPLTTTDYLLAGSAANAAKPYSTPKFAMSAGEEADMLDDDRYSNRRALLDRYGNKSIDREMLDYNSDRGYPKEQSFLEKLGTNALDFVSKPKNLMALAGTGLTAYSMFNQPKPKTAIQEGREAKDKLLASQLTDNEIEEIVRKKALEESLQKKYKQKYMLPEEKIDIEPITWDYTPEEERKKTGRFFTAYNSKGQPIIL